MMGQGFDEIIDRAATRKGGEGKLRSLLGPAPDPNAPAELTDAKLLELLTCVVFRAGMSWALIDQKWPSFQTAFLSFSPAELIAQPDPFWDALCQNPDIIRNAAKITATRHNAQMVQELADTHGGFGLFLAHWPRDDQIGLMKALGQAGARLGASTAQYFLRVAGWDAFVLSADVQTALRMARVDLGKNAFSQSSLKLVQARFNEWQRDTGLSYRQMSRCLAFSVGDV